MKKAIMAGIALAYFMSGSAVFAAEAPGANKDATATKQELKVMPHHAVKKSTHHRMSAARVKSVQEALNAHGAKLKADGQWGKETREAIKSFQKESGMKPTGRLNKETRAKLGLK